MKVCAWTAMPATLSLVVFLCATLVPPASAAPDEELLGKATGYPIGERRSWFYDEHTRVGSFSNLDTILPHNRIEKSATPSPLPRAGVELQLAYRFDNRLLGIDDFLARQRITGLAILKDGQLLVERYQYDRKPTHRFVSHSMAKSITSLAVGLALSEGKIASLDDTVSKYVPKLAGCAYGDTSIRNILRMASGVRFAETYDGKDDLAKFGAIRASEGSNAAICAFKDRDAAQGSRFHYASSETVVLAALMQAVTKSTLSAYVSAKLWQPMGAEADATWITSRDGLEIGSGSFNAVLRDYARLGILLANDGAINGRQVLPKDYVLEATTWRRQPEAFAPRRATPYFGYGYQFWTYPGEKRRFALLGVYGQSIFVDPELKLVMVLTSVAKSASVGKESLAGERDALWRGLVAKFGAW